MDIHWLVYSVVIIFSFLINQSKCMADQSLQSFEPIRSSFSDKTDQSERLLQAETSTLTSSIFKLFDNNRFPLLKKIMKDTPRAGSPACHNNDYQCSNHIYSKTNAGNQHQPQTTEWSGAVDSGSSMLLPAQVSYSTVVDGDVVSYTYAVPRPEDHCRHCGCGRYT